MMLTCGPTGSGKTTTLYAFLNELNDPGVKIITLEDPIEYKLPGVQQTPIDHRVNFNFADGLRAILRQDPDIVMVGEIRDQETGDTALQAALTGHVVLSTIHTNDAVGAIPRLLQMGVKPFVIAPAMNAIIGQRLVRKLCQACKRETPLSKELEDRVAHLLKTIPEKSGLVVPKKLQFFHSPGCDECHKLGYKGRIGIFEVIEANAAVPGDALFGLDLAVEKARINFAGDDSKKNELKVKFAEERLAEAKTVVESRGSINVADIDLSEATVTEVEVDVFTNETTVKIEANDRHYGFTTTEKEKAKIIEEIKAKYKLTDAQINDVLSFETENRVSRADDKGFLNSENSGFKSSKQQREFEGSLSEVADLIANSSLSAEEKAKLSATLAGLVTLLEANPGLEMEIKTKDGFKVEVEDGKIEIKTNNGKSGDDDDDSDGRKKNGARNVRLRWT
jgi:hypothetical protein